MVEVTVPMRMRGVPGVLGDVMRLPGPEMREILRFLQDERLVGFVKDE